FSRPPCRTPAAPAVGALRKFLPRAPRCELGHDLLLRPRGTKVFSGLLTSFGHVSTLALQAAPPITRWCTSRRDRAPTPWWCAPAGARSEEHTSELQSRENLVCRLLLEKKKNIQRV